MQFDKEWRMFIDGEFVTAANGQAEVINPATGSGFTSAPVGTAGDINHAVEAARAAFEKWRWTDASERARKLRDCADRLEAHEDEFVELETLETGKPLSQSRFEVTDGANAFRFYAGAIDKFYGDTVMDTPDEMRKTVHEPYGVIGVIIPWNFPVKHIVDFAAPVLATGNTMVLKPAPETPLTSLRFAELVENLFPPGVLNVVTGGTEPGVALTRHSDVDKISFTGNDTTAEHVLEATAGNITPAMLELGGKNPELVFPDANLEKALSGVTNNVFLNAGQGCSCTERLLLHEDIYDTFLDRLKSVVESLVVDDGRKDGTEMGALINEAQRDKVNSYYDLAEEEGATVYAQGETPTDPELQPGYWAPPTVFVDVDPEMRFACEEVFGPVVGVIPFADEEEALEIANDTEYGLNCTLWTNDIDRAHRLAPQFRVGAVGINCPAGGVPKLPYGGYRRSGMGRKLDFSETMREFTQPKSVRIHAADNRFSLSSLE